MPEKRVCFDFEIEFSNGGGLQGQGFRLDIPGDDIGDADLGACIVKDLNLLMVGEVRILNKRIIAEAHKRRAPDTSAKSKKDTRLVDLSLPVAEGTVKDDGRTDLFIKSGLERGEPDSSSDIGGLRNRSIEAASAMGTCVEVGLRGCRDETEPNDIPLSCVSDLPGVVIRLRGHETREIDWPNFAAQEIDGRAVLIETGWSDDWAKGEPRGGHPYLTRGAAEFLRQNGAALVGIDSFRIDDTAEQTRPAQAVLSEAGIPVVDCLASLAVLPDEGFRFSAVPPRNHGIERVPVRAHALLAE